ncbi:hypothetical protein [Arthrobacter sp. 9V]|uniref:hypothetical protein n=1 Tax=Arthrobacter sp. 9V TaxID=2653132 RepID=UPI00135C6AC4|nr:hypothetical protein [Arthrobacter sp. 9V]
MKTTAPPVSGLDRRNSSRKVAVVVLGVMYPSVLPQFGEANNQLDLVPLPLGVGAGKQNQQVVFYDPLSPSKNGEEIPLATTWSKEV